MNDDEIKDVLEKIQPEGFDWVNCTETEMVKFRAIAEAQSKVVHDEKIVELLEDIDLTPNHYYPINEEGKRHLTPHGASYILSILNIPARIEAATKERTVELQVKIAGLEGRIEGLMLFP